MRVCDSVALCRPGKRKERQEEKETDVVERTIDECDGGAQNRRRPPKYRQYDVEDFRKLQQQSAAASRLGGLGNPKFSGTDEKLGSRQRMMQYAQSVNSYNLAAPLPAKTSARAQQPAGSDRVEATRRHRRSTQYGEEVRREMKTHWSDHRRRQQKAADPETDDEEAESSNRRIQPLAVTASAAPFIEHSTPPRRRPPHRPSRLRKTASDVVVERPKAESSRRRIAARLGKAPPPIGRIPTTSSECCGDADASPNRRLAVERLPPPFRKAKTPKQPAANALEQCTSVNDYLQHIANVRSMLMSQERQLSELDEKMQRLPTCRTTIDGHL